MRNIRSSLGFSLSIVTLQFLATGCLTGGERTSIGDGGGGGGDACVPDEVCSDVTPEGLYFGSAEFFGRFGRLPKTVAIGGVEEIGVYLDDSGARTFDEPFSAASTAGLSIDGVDGNNVTVRGSAVGGGYLRIVDPDNGELFDRIQISSQFITDIDVISSDLDFVARLEPTTNAPTLLWAGSDVSLGVVLTGDGDRLIDQALTASFTGATVLSDDAAATASLAPASWDLRNIHVADAGSVTATVHAGSANSTVSFDIVDDLDSIVELDTGESDGPIPLDHHAIFCFRAQRGANPVAGVPWSVSTTGVVTSNPFGPNCYQVWGESLGAGTFEISAGGLSLELDLEIVSAATNTSTGSQPKPEDKALLHHGEVGEH
ncbi:MAG: hypothetical protein U0271_43555 [Polyangiaceae bacterium]